MRRIGLFSLLFSMLGLYCSKQFDAPDQPMDIKDSIWAKDGDGDGIADSIEVWAPKCKMTLEECLKLAKENQQTAFLIWAENTPDFSADSGNYDFPLVLTITSEAAGELRYTLNGEDPTKKSLLFKDSLVLEDTTLIKAGLFSDGELISNIASRNFYIAIPAKAPSFSPEPSRVFLDSWIEGTQTYNDSMNVTLVSPDPTAVIRYTLDGSDPSSLNNGYVSPIPVGENVVIKARSYVAGQEPSPVVVAEYNLRVMEPKASILAGNYSQSQDVKLSISTPGAIIRYTTNGMEPTSNSTQYTTALDINKTTRLKAKGFKVGWSESKELNRLYTIVTPGQIEPPLIEPDGGTFISSQSITLTVASDTLDIYYSLDGSEPTTSSIRYIAPFEITKNTELKTKAIAQNGDTSALMSSSYIIQNAKPELTPKSGTYGTQQYVEIKSPDTGVTFYYTLDGSPPDTSSLKYSGSIEIGSYTTLKAISFKAHRKNSDVAVETYEFDIVGEVASPDYSPGPGIFESPTSITMSSRTDGAQIYYTLDDSDPGKNTTLYTEPFMIDKTTTVKARAFRDGLNPSPIREEIYEFKVRDVSFDPKGGTYYEAQSVTLSTFPENSEIYYTLDNTDPGTDNGVKYDGAILISATTTIKAVGVNAGFTNSDVQSASYTIEIAPEKTLELTSPVGGENWLSGTTEPITWSTTGDVNQIKIEYTLNGGTAWNVIENSVPNIGYYTWNIPKVESEQAKIRVSIAGSQISSESPSPFNISLPPESGLWAFYPFSGNVNDESGQGRHGNNFGADFVADRWGNSASAIQFNGNEDVVVVPGEDKPNMDDERGFTVSLWISPTFGTLAVSALVSHRGGENSGYYIALGNNNSPVFVIPGVGEVQAGRLGLTRGWDHIAARYSKGTLCIFLNGIKTEANGEGVFQAASAPLTMGAIYKEGSDEPNYPFRGTMDQLRIYNHALTDAEIQELYQNY